MSTDLLINPTLAPARLSADFAASGRLQVPDFLDATTAGYLHRLLQENNNWYLSYNEGSENFESDLAEFAALAPSAQQRFMSNLYGRARQGFQYVFRQYYISQALALGEQPGHPMHQVHQFVNSPGFLRFMRTLTARDDIVKSDSYASWYGPGHFLTALDDRHATHDRVAAYVISMTRDWNENWGGTRHFTTMPAISSRHSSQHSIP